MLLSIGMIVKNEEKYLDKCLSALKPILDNIDSELIIADTGSTDRTVEIAKKYTDKVLYFEWVKDFSAARNFTLDNSTGEWFMYIDADEILTSCDDIIRFFKSGEYKKFKSATYIQRNYTDFERSDYSDFNAPRMASRASNIRFVNPIHEAIYPFYTPIKHLTDAADHFGYVFETEEQRNAKCERNIELLQKQLSSDDTDMMLYLQLCQSFLMQKNTEKAIYYLNEGIAKCIEKNDSTLISLYAEKAAILFNSGSWQELSLLCEDYFNMPDRIRPGTISTDAEIYAFKAMAMHNLGKNKEAADDFAEFFRLYSDFVEGRLVTKEVITFNFNLAKQTCMGMLLYNFLNACIEDNRFNTVLQVMKNPIISQCYKDHNYTRVLLEQEFAVMRQTEYKRARTLYSQLDEYGRDWYHALVRFTVETAEDKNVPLDVFRKVCREDEQFSALLNVIYAHYIRSDCSSEIAELIKSGCTEYYELLYFMLSEQQDVSPLITSECYNLTEALSFCSDRFDDMFTILEKYYPEHISDIKAFLSLCEAAMLLSIQNQRDIEALFALWGKAVSSIENIDENDGQLYAAALANVILHSWHSNDIKTCIGAMSAAVKKYPQSKPFILAIRDKVQQSISAPKPNSEMHALASTVKKNIRSLISSGKTEEAKRVFEEYLKINPNDPDNEKLKNELNERQKL